MESRAALAAWITHHGLKGNNQKAAASSAIYCSLGREAENKEDGGRIKITPFPG